MSMLSNVTGENIGNFTSPRNLVPKVPVLVCRFPQNLKAVAGSNGSNSVRFCVGLLVKLTRVNNLNHVLGRLLNSTKQSRRMVVCLLQKNRGAFFLYASFCGA